MRAVAVVVQWRDKGSGESKGDGEGSKDDRSEDEGLTREQKLT